MSAQGLLRAAALLVALFWASMAAAHNRGTSYSEWQLTNNSAQVHARVPALELTRLGLDARYTPDYLSQVGDELSGSLQLWAGNAQCTAGAVSVSDAGDGWLTAHWALHCPQWQGLAIVTRLFERVAPAHLHFVRVERTGQPATSRVLSFGKPMALLATPQAAAASLPGYVLVGIQHILSGWDHLAFLLGLILIAPRLRELAVVATGFTLAHSLTLAAAVLGWVAVEQARVEALIGFSIAIVAAENLWLRSGRDVWIPRMVVLALAALTLIGLPQLPFTLLAALTLFAACYFGLLQAAEQPWRLRVALAFVFGLVHGFGFSGAMAELHLPPGSLAVALLGFNLGVECGQLLVIAIVWPLLLWLRRRPLLDAWSVNTVSAAVAGLGSFWFVTRLFAA